MYTGEPTLGQVMRRPLWILFLMLAIAVAGAFAWLGQWQMDHAIRIDADRVVDTETPRPLTELTGLSQGVTEDAAGMVVTVDGAFVPGDTSVVEQRVNGGEIGAWVVGNFATEYEARDAQLAVAIGWAPSAAEAEAARELLAEDPAFGEPRTLEGRYTPAEGPEIPGAEQDPQLMLTMMPAQLANVWQQVDGPVYAGFLVQHPDEEIGSEPAFAALGLEAIDSVPPEPPERVNWLNVFYAVEWVVFAGFAVFLWYRLARDAWEKEHELKLQAEAEAEAETGIEGGGAADPEARAATDPHAAS